MIRIFISLAFFVFLVKKVRDLRIRPRRVPRRGESVYARRAHTCRAEGTDRDPVHRVDIG